MIEWKIWTKVPSEEGKSEQFHRKSSQDFVTENKIQSRWLSHQLLWLYLGSIGVIINDSSLMNWNWDWYCSLTKPWRDSKDLMWNRNSIATMFYPLTKHELKSAKWNVKQIQMRRNKKHKNKKMEDCIRIKNKIWKNLRSGQAYRSYI
jgi:hypothetical protein